MVNLRVRKTGAGNKSYSLTLPSGLMEFLKWEGEDYIDIIRNDDGTLLLKNLTNIAREKNDIA